MKGQSIAIRFGMRNPLKSMKVPLSQQGSCDALHGHSAQNRSSSAHAQLTGPPLSHCSGITHPSLASKSRSWGPAYAPNADGRADALVIPQGWSAGAQTLPPLSVGHPGLQQDVVSTRNMRQHETNKHEIGKGDSK